MERRFLITIGQPDSPAFQCEHLERVSADIARIGRFFCSGNQGYEWVLRDELRAAATAESIRATLGEWFAAPERSPEDCVVIYWAGHGARVPRFNEHVLLTQGSMPEQLHSVVHTQDLVRLIYGSSRSPQSVLLMLDVCFAAQGAGELLARIERVQDCFRDGAGLWLLCAADVNTQARDGAFVNAFLSVMNDPGWAPRGGAEFVSPYDVAIGVNDVFGRNGLTKSVVCDVVQGGRTHAPFIRNPRFDGVRGPRVLEDDMYWQLKASGADAPGYPGWFFAGRRRALDELLAWLHARTSNGRAKVVTGAPGSGKSAVLGLLSVAADPTALPDVRNAGLRSLGHRIDCPVCPLQARGLRAEDLIESLCRALGVSGSSMEAALAGLSVARKTVCILLDSLDESAEATRIESAFLRPLADHPSVRLVVGTRKLGSRLPLADIADVINLDDPEYFQERDIYDYAYARLTSSALGSSYTAASERKAAHELAEAISRAANRSFLYARVVSRWYLSSSAARAGTLPLLPRDLTEVFELDLQRFPTEHRAKVRDLLQPLAWSRGRGLPHKNIWGAIASRMSNASYDSADVGWLIERAGYFLIQDVEHGETVYRLYHESFAEYLRLGRDAERDHRAMAEGLVDCLPAVPQGMSPWAAVREPYTIHHFAAHANLGGVLSVFLSDPEFLLTVSPDSLTTELLAGSEYHSSNAVRVYRKATAKIRAHDRVSAAAYLATAALHEGDPEFPRLLSRYHDASDWWPIWSVWEREIVGFNVARTDAWITALRPFNDETGAAWALFGHADGSVSLWKVPSGERVFHRKLTAPFSAEIRINDLAVAPLATGTVFIAVSSEHVWTLGADGEVLASQHMPDICALEYCESHSALAVAVCDFISDAAILLLSLPSLEVIASRRPAARATIYTLAAVTYQGKPALASGSDSMASGGSTEEHTLRFWSLPELKLLHESNASQVSNVRRLVACELWGRPYLVIATVFGRKVLLWDLRTNEFCVLHDFSGRSHHPLERVLALIEQDERATVLCEQYGRLLLLEFADDLKRGSRDVVTRLSALPRVFENFRFSSACLVKGRTAVLAAVEQECYLLDVHELLSSPATQVLHGAGEGASDVSMLTAHGSRVLCKTPSGEALLKADDGSCLWSVMTGGFAVAGVFCSGHVHVVTRFAELRVLDADTGDVVEQGVQVGKLASCAIPLHWHGETWLAIAIDSGSPGREGGWSVRIWNPRTREEVPFERRHGRSAEARRLLRTSDPEKPLNALSAHATSRGMILAFAGPHGEVHYANLDEPNQGVFTWYTGQSGHYVLAIAGAVIGDELLMVAGTDDGRLFGRNLSTQVDLWSTPIMMGGVVNALRVLGEAPPGVFAAGDSRGLVHVLTFEGRELMQIDIGRPVQALAWVEERQLVVGTDRGVVAVELSLAALLGRLQ